MEETEIFQQRSGTADRGKDYENVALSNIVLQMVSDAEIKNFHISSNDSKYGAFDDIVIKIISDKGNEIIKAIQLKHTDTRVLSLENLKTKKGDFSIRKYFESFQEIGNAADEFIIFTNRPFRVNDEVKFQLDGEEFNIKPIKVNGKLELSKCVNCVYKFQIVEDLSSLQNISRAQEYNVFFNKFYLYANQENFHKLRTTTAEMFKETYSSNEEIFDKFLKIISEWNIQKGKKEKLNKTWMQSLVALQLLSSQIEPLSSGLVNEKMKILREAISVFDMTVFENQSCQKVKQLWGDILNENIDLKEINRIARMYQLSTNYIDQNNIKDLDPKAFAQLLWLMNKCPLILHENENTKRIIQLCPDKHIILFCENADKEWMKNYSVFRNLSNLRQRVDLYGKLMQDFTISIQGKVEVNLVETFGDNEDILESVTTDSLIEMLNGPCYIGGQQETLPEPYIERYITRHIINITYLEQVRENTVIILNCADNFYKVESKLNNYKLVHVNNVNNLKTNLNKNKGNFDFDLNKSGFDKTIYITNNDCSQSELQQIYNENTKAKEIHYFKLLDDGNLEWVTSKGDVSDLEGFKLSNNSSVNENALWSSQLNNNINLIIGDPGMGKSELMKSFKNNCSRNHWTIMINPQDVNSFFSNTKNSNYSSVFKKFILNEKCYSPKQLDRKIFEVCLKENKVFYVWDALDEILSEHLNAVLKIILHFSSEGFSQWITSRQHLKSSLEKKFSVLSASINQFGEQEQQDYIWKRLDSFIAPEEIEITVQKIKSTFVIVDHVDILGIPLQIFMLTELFRQNYNKYLELLNNTFLLTDLYNYFIEEKFIIFYKNKMAFDLQNPHIASRISEEKQKGLDHYEKLAFKVIFPENVLQRLDIDYQKHKDKIEKKYQYLGLIKEFQDNVPQFLHGSFAEYLVALYFSKNDKNIPVDIIFDAKCNNVRFFFDMLKAKNSPAHIAVLYKNYELLKTYDDETLTRKDEGGRSALHLICSWGQRHPRLSITRESYISQNRYIVEESDSFNGKADTEEYFEAVEYLQSKNSADELDLLLNLTPLSYARKSESLGAEIKLFQVKKSELNQSFTSNDKVNILYYSALLGYDVMTELCGFQKSNDNCNEANFVTAKNGSTPLLLACEKDHLKLVESFVISGAEINGIDNNGETPLYVASQNGYEKIVEYLVKAGTDINRAKIDGATPLFVASKNGHEKTVQYLVNIGAEINRARSGGYTPLYVASQNGYETIVEYLVKAGADINGIDKDGATPLYIASQNGHKKNVEFLVKAGAEINRGRSGGYTPLFVASQKGHEKTVEYLVKAGAEINRPGNDGQTPLYIAAKYDHKKTVEYLVKAGAEVNRVDKDGATPLYIASENGHEKTVEYLVKAGAEINRARNGGYTPLYLASQNGHEKTVEYLVKAGAEINRAQIDGATPLYIACQNGHEKTVEYLVKAGADFNRATNNGCTPLFIATQKDHKKIVACLRNAGANFSDALAKRLECNVM